MTDKYRVVFTGLEPSIDSTQAANALALKLKTSPDKILAFCSGKPLFSPADKSKASKQVKLLNSVGILAKLTPLQVSTELESQTHARDERIFGALDYITSSLIRIEERLEDIEQKLADKVPEQEKQPEDEWQEDELFDEFELDSPSSQPRSRTLLYFLIATLIFLLIVLAMTFVFPDLFKF